MVKRLFCILLVSIGLWGDGVDESIENFIGKESFYTNQNFINRLFKDKQKFYTPEHDLDYYAILKTLKDNGLLELVFKQPSEVRITFNAKTSPIFLTRLINNTLSSLGYSYFTVSKARYIQKASKMTFLLVTEHIVDPVVMLNELKKRGLIATKIFRANSFDWEYELEVQDLVMMGATRLDKAVRLELKNISGEYWFSTKVAGKLQISKKNNRIDWYPRIVLFDKNLQILEIITQESVAKSAEINITDQTAFVMVTDLNNPTRLKYGINVLFTPF